MSVEKNLRVGRATTEAFNLRDWDRYLALCAESILRYSPGQAEPMKGRRGLREELEAWVAAFPDIRAETTKIFGQDDWVCEEAVATGTHRGAFHGPRGEMIPATGKHVRLNFCHVYKVENGLVTEDHVYFDQLDMLGQLGVTK